MLLVCSRRCGGSLFRAPLATVDVDAGGDYQAHQVIEEAYLCLSCGAPALDLSQVGGAMAEEEAADVVPERREVLCPVCETLVEVGSELECPMCGAYLEGLEAG